jgi:hypothetical protein
MTLGECMNRITYGELVYWVAWFEYTHQQQETEAMRHGKR